jgi:predicted ATPase/class 3 adenylate cyclase
MTDLPTGTVTFLFTDLEGSTRLWEEQAVAMTEALARHDDILRTAVEHHGGSVVKTTGDGVHAVFATAPDALDAAVEAQRMLVAERWCTEDAPKVRMGVHTGAAQVRDGDYYGSAVNRAARVMAAAHGGQVVVSLATEALVQDSLPQDVALEDLGAHRLRDLARPERIFQVVHPDLPSDFPPLTSVDAASSNLPTQVTSFVGREGEVAAVARALTESRMVTLTGVGGVGKTRLAIHVAAEVLPRFPDGTWLCELAVATEPEEMFQVIATAMGVQPRSGASIAQSIGEFLHAKQLLIVMDNCEHLLDAAARFADSVLRDTQGVRILATSREGLAVDGEHLRALRSLSVPQPSDDLDALMRSDAGRLFVDRARAVDASFVLDATTSEAIAEVCRRVDGVPLAIELAAARSVAMTPAEIAARLDERFRLLTGGRRTAVERHQTLRATVDWSFSLCSPTEQSVFVRLGVFAGSFSASSAEAVATADVGERWEVIEALAGLVAKSMVIGDRAADGSTRYSMLETLRAYARERLDEFDDADIWRRRHAEHYAAFAEEACAGLEGPDEHVWHERIRLELDNVRAAINWSLDSDVSADGPVGLRIVASLAYAAIIDMIAGVRSWTERAVPRVQETTPGLRTAILGAAAIQAIYVGDQPRAETLALDALRDGLPADCPVPEPAYSARASFELNRSRPEVAVRIVRQGLQDLEAAGYGTCQLSKFHSSIAVFSTYCGDVTTAREEAAEALRLAREVDNPSAVASALWASGRALVRADPPASLVAFEGYVAMARTGVKSANLGWSLGDVSWLKARAGDRPGALRAARDGLQHDLRSGNRTNLAGALNRIKLALVELGAAEPAAVLTGAELRGALVPWAWGDEVEVEAEDREHAIAALRSQLGAEEYERATRAGSAMTFDQVVECTLLEVERMLDEMDDDDSEDPSGQQPGGS